MITASLVALLWWPLLGGAPLAQATSARVTSRQAVDELIKMERLSCFGVCPAYSVVVHRDGSVAYLGKFCVKKKGSAQRILSRDEMGQLLKVVAKAGLAQLPKPCCGCNVDDSPEVALTINMNGQILTIFDNQGCPPPTPALRELEAEIDRITSSHEWVGSADERKAGCPWH
jgi:hypothetical protein